MREPPLFISMSRECAVALLLFAGALILGVFGFLLSVTP